MDVPNPQGALRAGMMAYVEIAVNEHKGVLAVPSTALQTNKQGTAIFTVEAGKAKRIPVQAGFMDHAWTEVSGADLTERTLVIKDVSKGINDGAAVDVGVPTQAAAH
jgi:multidrug efflux pump subunit AcrA (membrane-fusion protein)